MRTAENDKTEFCKIRTLWTIGDADGALSKRTGHARDSRPHSIQRSARATDWILFSLEILLAWKHTLGPEHDW